MTKRTSLKARNASVQAAMVAAKGNDEPAKKSTTAAKGKPVGGKPVGLSIRLAPDTHDALRKIAFERRVSIHSLFLEGVNFVVEKYGG